MSEKENLNKYTQAFEWIRKFHEGLTAKDWNNITREKILADQALYFEKEAIIKQHFELVLECYPLQIEFSEAAQKLNKMIY